MTDHTNPNHPLRLYRLLHKITAAQLAEKIGVTEAGMRHWENGTRPIPAEQCVAIEKAIGVDRAILRPDLFRREAA